MTNNDAAWYEDMAKAMKTREKCLSAIERWMDALREAERTIAVLAAKREVPDPETPKPVEPFLHEVIEEVTEYAQ